MRRPLRSAFVVGVLIGLVLALARALTRESRPTPAPLAAPPLPIPATTPSVRAPVPVVAVAPAPQPAPTPEPVIGSAGSPFDPVTGSDERADDRDSSDGEPAWVAPVAGGCPDGYPIKAKASSGIYHRPGGLSYERTRPDRCYSDEASAESDGFRAAKR